MLTPVQKILVQESFAKPGLADDVAELFYDRLFELDPSLRHLFRGDVPDQRKTLTLVLTVAVKELDRLDQLVSLVEDLGGRLATYGVKEADYDTVGEALLWALRVTLGWQFTPELEGAWTAAYGLLSSAMKSAARHAEYATYAEIC